MIIMVLVLIGLLAMLGLAIDGGTVFLERRRMQNAADAAALAGTRRLAEAICGDTDATDGDIAEQVNHYAEINGVPSGNVVADYVDFDEEVRGHVGDGTIPDYSTGISVTVEISRSTHFVTLIGIDTAGASADALAMTGPPLLAGGMRPFGVPLQVMQQTDVGDCFTIDFKNCDDAAPDDCLIKDDDGDTIGHHRNWLNLNHVWNQGENPDFPRASGDSGTADDLKNWMANGWNGTLYADCFWSGGSNYYYHIVGFAAVRVPTGGDADQGGGTIRACVKEVIMGQGQPSPNEGYQSGGGSEACDTHTMVVTLWR
jgi:hypothetical protein